MITTRRSFLQTAAIAGAGIAVRSAAHAQPKSDSQSIAPAEKKLNLLILGGTGFLGPHIVEYAMGRGHTITLFNRGRTNDALFPTLEKLRGDRDPSVGEGLNALKDRKWDGAIDTSGYLQFEAEASAGLLADQVEQYIFISTVSVYADNSQPGMNESAELATVDDETIKRVQSRREIGMHYGAFKALCEQAVEAAMPGRTTIIRPGLIVGPRDYSDRFTYWPVRVQQGGEILAPGTPDDPVQYIDVRDLAAFIVRTLEHRTAGVFNATGPNWPTSIGALLHGCIAVTGGDARLTWVDAQFLREQGVRAWMDVPVWIPPADETAGFHRVSIARAVAAGLESRPLAQTVSDTLAWFADQPELRQQALAPEAEYPQPGEAPEEGRVTRRAGMSAAREAEVLEAWHARIDLRTGD